MHTRLYVSTFCLSTLSIGCLAASPPELAEDPLDAAFTDGKADTGGLVDGTAIACAILQVANTLSESELREDVDLSERAAGALVAYRNGDSETTLADDQRFDSLAELDAVPYIGPIAFGKLRAFAEAEDYVDACEAPPPPVADDPFDDAACSNTPMTASEAASHFAPGTESAPLAGPALIYKRQRLCYRTTGCTAWSAPEPLRPDPSLLSLWTNGAQFFFELRGSGDWAGFTRYDAINVLSSFRRPLERYDGGTLGYSLNGELHSLYAKGNVGAHCAQVIGTTEFGGENVWYELEVAYLARY